MLYSTEGGMTPARPMHQMRTGIDSFIQSFMLHLQPGHPVVATACP